MGEALALTHGYHAGGFYDDNDVGLPSAGLGRRTRISAVVRDVSWHPYEGVLVHVLYALSNW